MLLTNSSPRQSMKCLVLLLVLSLLCGCDRRDASLYPPKSDLSNIPVRTSASANNASVSPTQTVLAHHKPLRFGASIYGVDGIRNASLVIPVPTHLSISVSPTRVSLYPSQTLQFLASVKGSTHHAVRWFVEGHEGGDVTVGTVSATGVYTAPPGPAPWPSVTITAVSARDSKASASAVVTIMLARLGTSSGVDGTDVRTGTAKSKLN